MQRSRSVVVILLAALILAGLSIGQASAQDTSTPIPPQIIIVTATPTPAAATSSPVTPPAAPSGPFTLYTIQPGDTLSGIARRNGTTVAALVAANGIVNPSLIFWGAQLKIPTSAQSTPQPGASNTPAPATAVPAAPPTPVPGGTTTYVVAAGDTLFRIALRFHTTVAELVRLNSLSNPNFIYSGQRLTVSGGGGTTGATATPVGAGPTAIPNVTGAAFGFGAEALFDGQDPTAVISSVTTLGLNWVKVDVNWRDLETTQGQMDFTSLDSIVNAAVASNIKVLFTVSTSPTWARTSTEESGPPDNYANYTTFVTALAQRYAGKVQAYEIWNEPNLRREWNSTVHNISAASYIELLRDAYAAIKAADPAAQVISAGLAPTGYNDGVNAINDRVFLQSLYASGLANISDGVGAHPMGWANPPDATCCNAPVGVATHYQDRSFFFLDTLNDYRQIMAQNGDSSTPIWATRFGWGSSEDTTAPSAINVFVSYTSLGEQAIYIPRGFALGASLGFVGPMFVYNLNSCQAQPGNADACYYSLIGPGGTPRPAYGAVQSAPKTVSAPAAVQQSAPPAPAATQEASG